MFSRVAHASGSLGVSAAPTSLGWSLSRWSGPLLVRAFSIDAPAQAPPVQPAPAQLWPTASSSSSSCPSVTSEPHQKRNLSEPRQERHLSLNQDRFGRRHNYLRVSLTDRCNFRCQYCMPENPDEIEVASNPDLLTADEIGTILRVMVRQVGVNKIRLTGGEPTLRSDFGAILETLGELREEQKALIAASSAADAVTGAANASTIKLEELSLGLTTNGLLLHRHMDALEKAGVTNLNFSLDTLIPADFGFISRRPQSWFHRVRKNIQTAIENPAFKVKINCVLMRKFNEGEIPKFINEFVRDYKCEVRFIEFMPFQKNAWSSQKLFGKQEILDVLHKNFPDDDIAPMLGRPLTETAQLWKGRDWKGRMGIISSMTDQFCGGCNRIRLTADGKLKNCLFGVDEFDLIEILRQQTTESAGTISAGLLSEPARLEGLGKGREEAQLIEEVRRCLLAKNAKLGGKKSMHELAQEDGANRPMVSIGG